MSYPYPQYAAQAPEPETNYTAGIALFIAIIVLIALIVVIFLFYNNASLVVGEATAWNVVTGTGTSASFGGDADTIFRAPAATTNYDVTITPYTNIATLVTASRTTVFKIDNTSNSTASVVLGGTIPVGGGKSDPKTIPPNCVYEYQWITTSTYKLIGWSNGP